MGKLDSEAASVAPDHLLALIPTLQGWIVGQFAWLVGRNELLFGAARPGSQPEIPIGHRYYEILKPSDLPGPRLDRGLLTIETKP